MTDRDRILGLLEEIHSLVEENGNADGTLRFDAEGNCCLGLCQNGDRKDDFGANSPNGLTISVDYAILTL